MEELVTPSTILVVVAAEIDHTTKMVQMDETIITVTQPLIGNLLRLEWSATFLVAHLHLLDPTMLTERQLDLHPPTVVNPEDHLGLVVIMVVNREEASETIMVVDRMILIEVEMTRTDRKVVTLAEAEEIHIVAAIEDVEQRKAVV